MKIDIRNQFIVKEIFVHDVARAVEDEDLRKLVWKSAKRILSGS